MTAHKSRASAIFAGPWFGCGIWAVPDLSFYRREHDSMIDTIVVEAPEWPQLEVLALADFVRLTRIGRMDALGVWK